MASLNEDISSKSEELESQSAKKVVAERELQEKRDAYEKQKRQLWERIGHYESLVKRAERYLQLWGSHDKLGPAQKTKKREIDDSLADQEKVRSRQKKALKTLSLYFDATLKELLGEQAGGKIETNAQGVFPRPNDTAAASGAALTTSSTVLGFNLACLVASICGLGHHPRFLLHDSPREADMEAAMYHRLLRFAASLETVFPDSRPSFQYILTTTTQPPDELAGDPYVRATLHATDDSGLLLRTRF